jgi:predicted AAA+ superfamily ATPase
MYVSRALYPAIKSALQMFPAVLVTGPRQSGKTTFLLKEAGKGFGYVSFDDPLERNFAKEDPNGFLDRFSDAPVILDEIQYAPEILPYLKMRIDRDRQRNGKWLLTGSQQFQLMSNISESLAGRVGILELYPFSFIESGDLLGKNLESSIWLGGYPEPVIYPEKHDLWIRSYIQTYLERDVRQLINVKDIGLFNQFLGMCAARHSQVFNQAEFSRQLGISQPTAKAWANVLSASYITYLLRPFYRNFGKRITKTPKLYFIDPSLVCTLTRQPDANAALSGNMAGALFEGFVVSEALKCFAERGMKADLYYWRSHDGVETDLIIQLGGKLIPVEIKLSATPTERHIRSLEKVKKIMGDNADSTGLLVCRVTDARPLPGGNQALPWHEFPRWLREKIDNNKR